MSDKLLVINSDPKSEKHICYYVERDIYDSRRLCLYEVLHVTYAHPQASEYANVVNVETRRIGGGLRTDNRCATWVILEAAQKAVSEVIRLSKLIKV